MTQQPDYVPALGLAGLTPAYDAAMATLFQEQRFRRRLVDSVHAAAGDVIVDVGCGTATVSLMIQQESPEAVIAALDIDPIVVAAAQRKSANSCIPIRLTLGSAACLPYADHSADHVVSSLMFHHLPHAQKGEMLREILRILRPGGHLHLLDLGPPASEAWRTLLERTLSHFEHVDDNLHGRIPALLEAAGFEEVSTMDVAFGGLLKLFEGIAPA